MGKKGVGGSKPGRKMPWSAERKELHRELMSSAHVRSRIKEGLSSYIRTPEHTQAITDKCRTDEVRKKISDSLRGRMMSPEAVEKGRIKRIGQRRTPEQKMHISAGVTESNRSRPPRVHSDAARKNQSQAVRDNTDVHSEGVPCDLCGLPFKRLVQDHCHTTGTLRGKLCRRCNLALGFMKDDSSLLRKAADYLEKYRG